MTTTKRTLGTIGYLIIAGAVLLVCPRSAEAQTDDPCVVTGAETVRAEHPHYLPFETVRLSGRGYGPSCDFKVEVAGPAGSSGVLATTDGAGNLAATYDLGADTGGYTVSVLAAGGAAAASAAFTSGTYVMADRAEYAPHDPVTISGRGWQPGETVSLLLEEQPAMHPFRTLTATADAQGSFVNTSFSPDQHDAGVAFTLTATGSLATAQTKFGDSAVAFDSASSGTSTGNVATSVSFPHTIGNGNNRLLVVSISTRPNAPTNVKYGGVPMISAGAFTNLGAAPRPRVEFFYLLNPPTGTANVTYTITAGSVAGSTSFSGVYQPVPFGSSAGAFGTSPGCGTGVLTVCGNPQPSVTVLNGPNDLILDALSISVGTGNSSVAAGAGQTKRWDIRQGGPTVKMRGTGSTKGATDGATNMSWTLSAAGGDGGPQWVIAALPIQAVMPADRFTVTTSTAATSAGGAFDVTVTAQDQYYNTATTYSGTVQLTSADGQAILPANYTFVPGDNGVHTFSGVILGTVGVWSITATDADDAMTTGTGPDVTVSAGPLDHLALAPASATITFGGSQAYTAEGFDQFNNSRGGVTGLTAFSTAPDGACAGAVCTPASAGAHLVTGNAGGKTGTANLEVEKASQTIAFSALAAKTFGDAEFSVGATSSSGLPVAFTASGNCAVAGALVHLTGAGSCTVTAQQTGDTNYLAAADVPQTFSIAKASQTIAFAALSGKTWGDADFNVGATSSSGLPVSFTASGNCTVAGTLVQVTSAGSCTVTAHQAGNVNYGAAPDVSRSFPIATGDSQGPVVSNLLAAPNPAPVGAASIALTAMVSDAAMGGSNVASARYRIDGDSSVAMSAADSAFDSPAEAVAATLPGFTAAGVHNICVSGTDSVGNAGAEECVLFAAYDATGGFVTGGGWISPPAGALPASRSLTGKANFSFNAKYEKGMTVPTGDTQFQLQVANFKFKSTSYEWLVVSGSRAQYLGSGTVNGSGKYGFVVTVVDGKQSGGDGADRARLKVYDQNRGNAVVFDSQPGAPDNADPTTALGGGSIVIHK